MPDKARAFCLCLLALFLPVLGCAPQQPERRAVAPASPSPELDKKYPNRARFGMNLAGVVDWTREWPLVDAFKHSRPWITKGDGKFTFDEHGNPLLQAGQSVHTLLLREIDGHYPKGVYMLTYEGKGKINARRWDVSDTVKEEPGRIEINVVPGNGGIQVEITESDPKDPIRNVRVWMPGFENAKSPFHPLFLERLEPFGVLRFMDCQKTNDNPLKSWAERPKLTDARYSTNKGVPVELMIELANTRKVHPWFCMPHQADDDFVRSFAKLVKDKLDPDLRVYIEYSNEVWNRQFGQARYAQQMGKGLKLSDNDFQAQLRFCSQRSVEVFKIWEDVFGGPKRLVRVLAAQAANTWVSEQVLTWKDAHKHCDALAVAPYFGHKLGNPKTALVVNKMTVDQLLDDLDKEVDGPNKELMQKQEKLARKYNLELVAYEGGQHLAGHGGAENDETLTKLFHAANRHPRMADLYKKHLTHWFASGGGLYVVFSNVGKPSKWGAWGVLEYQDQPIDKAPKYGAIVEFIKKELPGK